MGRCWRFAIALCISIRCRVGRAGGTRPRLRSWGIGAGRVAGADAPHERLSLFAHQVQVRQGLIVHGDLIDADLPFMPDQRCDVSGVDGQHAHLPYDLAAVIHGDLVGAFVAEPVAVVDLALLHRDRVVAPSGLAVRLR